MLSALRKRYKPLRLPEGVGLDPRAGIEPALAPYQGAVLPLNYQGSWSQCPELHGNYRVTRAALCYLSYTGLGGAGVNCTRA